MGLLTILKKVKEQEKEVRILILGLDNAGKTTICKKFCGQAIDKIEPTLGFQIHTIHHEGYQCNLWDIGGQTSIRAYWRNYFDKSTDGLIWVVDSSDLPRLDMCAQQLQSVVFQQERLAGATVLILANKQDVDGALSVEEIANRLGLQEQQQQNDDNRRHWAIFPCSAVSGENLVPAMTWLVQDIGNRIFTWD